MQAVDALKLVNVTRRFGKTTALADLNLTIPGRSFVTLLGPSGCGKSTALNCLAGLDRPTTGEIYLNGERIDHLAAESRGFGMVFQSYALFPHLNVFKNVAFGLAIRGTPKSTIATKVTEALRMMRLSGFEERYPSQLSGGQQQRLAFARAVVLEPRLLLLDEPLSNLDAKLREELKSEIKRLHDRLRITTIHVTHDQSEAMALSDLVVVMRAGKVEQAGTPQEIYNRPASLFVADFMGYGNRLSMTVEHADGGGAKFVGSGLSLLATGRFDLQPRQGAVVCFREGDVIVGDGATTGNGLKARVRQSEFQGNRYAVEAVLPNGEVIRFHHGEPLAQDREVSCRIPEELLMVYPEAPAETAAP